MILTCDSKKHSLSFISKMRKMSRQILFIFCIVISLIPLFQCYVIDDSVGLGRRFDGIGGLSGGGATSKLLVNYPELQRSKILDYLFKPNFGASLQILKVEIGGDSQSTDGTESSHMHESWDENYMRGYEWWLMVEAKKRNPDIKLYGLPWAFPGWIGGGGQNPYVDAVRTSDYIVKWITGAKKYYNLTIDYIGIWNERAYNITYIKTLWSTLQSNNLSHVQIVASDSGWLISKDITHDHELAAAVSVVGCHYPGTLSNNESVLTKKPLWASEDYSTFNDDIGGGCWARILNQNYVNGLMTSTISWNLIASYYPDLPFGGDGLMTAQEPWSGHYSVQTPIWITAHTSQFTDMGWYYLQHGSGVQHLDKGGSFVTLIGPSRDITIVIETMSHDHSICIRPALPKYSVEQQTASFQLKGNLSGITQLYVWQSQFYFDGRHSDMFNKLAPIKVSDGSFSLDLDVDVVYTLTTMQTGNKGSYGAPPPSSPFPKEFIDDFEKYNEFEESHDFVPQVGVWEVRQRTAPQATKVNRQVVLQEPVNWCNAGPSPINIGGNHNWSYVFVQADILIPSVNGTKGVFLAARVSKGGCGAAGTAGVFFFLFPSDQEDYFEYKVTNNTAMKNVFASGRVNATVRRDEWFHMALDLNDDWAFGFFNYKTVFEIPLPQTAANGYVAYGTSEYAIADFDNIKIRNTDSRRPVVH